ncbi:TPA: hypothetical protein DEP58_01280 [Patescibacteria group bacterium]|nr:MAG: hypothetical protein UU98_C0035G0006 [Parcubacteria group bacterium GW2011_GWD2_42_14]HCC04921.1 hypothetical protein [Patescibacteria group bacterium]
MNEIFFPSQYKKALVTGAKNTTIRIGNERGKYAIGKTYSAKSYTGRDWNLRVKILKITQTTLGGLLQYGIPKRSIETIQKKENIALNEKVELVRFETQSS